MYTCNKKLHFSRTSVPDLISIKRPVVNGQITVQNWSISTTEETSNDFKFNVTFDSKSDSAFKLVVDNRKKAITQALANT